MKFRIILISILFFVASQGFSQTFTLGAGGSACGGTVNDCSATLLDPGGAGNYSNGANCFVTFCPDAAGQAVQINFTQFNTESGFDFVSVYSGTGIGGPILMGPLSGATMPNPTLYQSQAANGCVTVQFTSDGSVVAAGFSVTISCFTPPSCTDGIMNGNEQGVDCGGCSGCPPCPGSVTNNASVTAASNILTLPCGGGNVNLSAVGTSTVPVLGSNFNAGTPGPGWSVSPAGQFNNPCGPGPNGAHMWMGATTAAPRTLQTNGMDVRCGGQICFGLRFSVQAGASPCEGPDEPDEGVLLQYSTNCGTTWTNIVYFHPNGTQIAANPGTNTPSISGATAFTTWNNYCFNIPAGAQTASTMFRWFQGGSSGTCCDHWGIDEVTITAQACLPYYYDWLHVAGAPNSQNVTTNVTSTTTFTVLYTNGVDDTASANVTVVVNGPGTPTAAVTTEPCFGSNQGTSTITVTGGTPPFTYAIAGPTSASNSTGIFNNLPPGNYTVTVTQGGGCSSTGSFTITPGPICCSTTVNPTSSATCNGACNGSATANPSGGQAPYSYVWLSGGLPIGQTTQTASNLCAGTYTVQVTDASGCVVSGNVTVTQPTALGGTATPVAALCNGVCNGQVNVTGSGGTAPYTFSIDGGAPQLGTNFPNLCSGPHIVIVTDANGCTFTINTNVTQPPVVTIAITNNTPATCGASNGSVTVAGAGGTGALQYSINGGTTFQASGTFAGLAAGTYTIIVRDANGCQTSINVTVTNSSGPAASIGAIQNVTCAGGVNGQVIINVAGGQAPLSFDLNPGPTQASNTFSGLLAGAYSVIVTDGNGCTSTVNFNITSPTQLTFNSVPVMVTCNGVCNGQITVNAANATPPYEYSSNGGLSFQPSNVLTGLCAGTYNVVVRDANGCLANANVNITQPAAITGTLVPVNPLCQGVCNGSITVSPSSGGTGVLQYNINGGAFQASNVFPNLCSGTHNVIIQDANGCQRPLTIALVDPPGYSLNTVSSTPSNCGFNDGGFEVAAAGGAGCYMYENVSAGLPPQASGVFTSLVAGAYEVHVTDCNGCVEVTFVGVNDIQMSGQLNFVTDATCFGICDGTVSTIATGGGGTITYDLDNGLQTQFGSGDFVGLCAGPHAVTMTDQGFCVFVVPFDVLTPANIQFTTATTNITCNAGANGTITFNLPTGGTAPYQYSIDNGATYQLSPNFAGLAAGTYQLMVQDANSCTMNGTATLTQPTAVSFTTNHSNLTCFGNNTGSIQVVASGGTGGYTYSNNNGATFGPSLSFFALAAGTYNIVVMDNSGCTANGTVTVTQPAALGIAAVTDSANCNGSCDGTITVTANGGTLPYLYSPDNGTIFQTGNVLANLCAGAYTVMVRDSNGCTITTNQTILEPTQVTYTVVDVSSTCGNANGSLTINASNGTPGYQYSIDGGVTFVAGNTFNGLAAQNYDVAVEDQYGCTVTSIETVLNDASPVINAVINTDPLCFGDANGTATVTATGGTGALQYSIDGGALQASNVLTGLTAGPHVVTVTDANGCTDTQNINLNEPAVVGLTSTVADLDCFGDFSGAIQVTASGGTGSYQYSFDGGTVFTSSPNNNFIAAGTYNLVVEDANGCQATGTATVAQPAQLTFSLFNTFDATCNGFCDGAVTAFVSGGTVSGIYNFNWSGGIAGPGQAQATGVCAGAYSLIVTDDNGCLIDTTWVITEPNPVIITSVIGTDALCAGSCDAIIDITCATATQYSIDGGATFVATNIFNGLCQGNYDIMVQDATGCEAISNITLYEPSPLTITSTPDAFICYAGDMNLSALAVGGTAPYQYTWSNGVNTQNQIVNPTTLTTFSVFAVDTNGCVSATVDTDVDVSPLFFATVSPTDTVCPGNSSTITVQGFDGQAAYIYEWNTGDTTASITVTPTAPTTYTVIAKDQCNHYDTLTVLVDFYPVPQIAVTANPYNGCAPLDVTLYNSTVFPSSGAVCQWQTNGSNFASCDSIQTTYTTPGCYDVTLTMTSAEGCVGDSTFTDLICVYPNPVADFIWSPTDPTTLNSVVNFIDQSTNAAQYVWDFSGMGTSNLQNPTFDFDADTAGNYIVCLTVTSADGCVADTCKTVFIADEFLIYVPNAFTPDGDGLNDVFFPVTMAVDPQGYEFMIFNRWGELIFEGHAPGVGWDGTYKARESKQDVYVWKLKCKAASDGEQRVYYGHVSLLR